jgi:hypothetical protein
MYDSSMCIKGRTPYKIMQVGVHFRICVHGNKLPFSAEQAPLLVTSFPSALIV